MIEKIDNRKIFKNRSRNRNRKTNFDFFFDQQISSISKTF